MFQWLDDEFHKKREKDQNIFSSCHDEAMTDRNMGHTVVNQD